MLSSSSFLAGRARLPSYDDEHPTGENPRDESNVVYLPKEWEETAHNNLVFFAEIIGIVCLVTVTLAVVTMVIAIIFGYIL